MRPSLARNRFLVLQVTFLLSWTLHAEDEIRCNAETPCPENYVCEHATPPPSDPTGPDTSPPPPMEGEDGFCIYVGDERACTSDADCDDSEFCEMTNGENCSAPPCMPGGECPPVVCDSPASEGRCVTWSSNGFGECTSDDDCAEGASCQFTSVACPAPDCAPDQECPSMECPEESVGFCEWAPMTCTADSDCGEGEVCYTADVSDCAMATTPCEIDDEGFVVCDEDQSDNAECESEMISFCIARHYLACENDADCGEGFTCHAIEICECQGGGESSPGSDDAPQPEPEENCQCESADEGYCELQEIPCASDEACPSGLVCVFSSAGGATDSACAVDSNGNESCPTEPERDTSDEEPAGEDGLGFCAPPGGYGENSPQPGAPGSNSDSNTDEPRAEGDDDAAEVPTTQDDAETEPDDEAETGSFWMLNCSASQGPTALWLLLVSLFLVRVRRSRRS